MNYWHNKEISFPTRDSRNRHATRVTDTEALRDDSEKGRASEGKWYQVMKSYLTKLQVWRLFLKIHALICVADVFRDFFFLISATSQSYTWLDELKSKQKVISSQYP